MGKTILDETRFRAGTHPMFGGRISLTSSVIDMSLSPESETVLPILLARCIDPALSKVKGAMTSFLLKGNGGVPKRCCA